MPVQLHSDYPANTRNGNTCSSCSCGHRILRDTSTGALSPERVVDFFVNIDFEGYAMFCEQCVLEAAAMLGWVSAAVHDRTQAYCALLVSERDEAIRERDEAKRLVDDVLAYRKREAPSFVGVPEPALVGSVEASPLSGLPSEPVKGRR